MEGEEPSEIKFAVRTPGNADLLSPEIRDVFDPPVFPSDKVHILDLNSCADDTDIFPVEGIQDHCVFGHPGNIHIPVHIAVIPAAADQSTGRLR